MIEINQDYIVGLVFLVLIISFWFKNKLDSLKHKILFLNADIDYLERETNELKAKNISLEEKLLNSKNNEKYLNIEILQLNRLKNNSKIKEEELSYFANNPENGIELSMCDKNAFKVYEKFGGKIKIGKADVFKNGKFSHETNGHLWNVIKYIDNNVEIEQLIDILNYKDNQDITYTNHNGQDIPVNEVLTDKKFNYIT